MKLPLTFQHNKEKQNTPLADCDVMLAFVFAFNTTLYDSLNYIPCKETFIAVACGDFLG